MKIRELLEAKVPKPRNPVAKAAQRVAKGSGAHKDKKRAEKQGDVKHKKDKIPMEGVSSKGIPKAKEDKFHSQLDKLVHKTFGHSPDEKKEKKKGVSEAIEIGSEWMSDTELDQYVPDDLQQEWRELVGYDEDGNAHPLWANMTGDYEPDVSDPQHRAWMVKVANKWFAMKKIPNVRFFDVRDLDDELEWLVQIGDQGVAEGSEDLDIQQLAAISDEALDKAYGYGRSSPGNTFGWQANLKSAEFAKRMIDSGETDIEKISDAIHKGWNVTAQKFVKNPDQFDDTEKLKAAGKLEAKLQQRAKLMKINYSELPDEEQEKDRVVARALLQAIKGQQDVQEGNGDTHLKRLEYDVRQLIDMGDYDAAKEHAALAPTADLRTHLRKIIRKAMISPKSNNLSALKKNTRPSGLSVKQYVAQQMEDEYGDGDITFHRDPIGGRHVRHEDDAGDIHSHQYDPETGKVDFRSTISATYYSEGNYNPLDYERYQQRQMDNDKQAFKRAELQHELGHEDDPDFERKMRQKQMDRDRGPWYLKINGKILKKGGEPKSFDWKKGANNYGLAILKNKPELKDKVFLTRNPNDDVSESATAGATSAANIGTVDAPHISPGKARGKKSYLGDPKTGRSGTKAPPQPKIIQPKNPDGTAKNAHEIKGASLFGGPPIKR